MATMSLSEASYRRYGRANYDVTPRVYDTGDEVFIETRSPWDSEDLEYVNSRVARSTYSQQSKAYPRGSIPRVSVVITSPYPPHCDVSKTKLDSITSRLMRPTLGSQLKQSTPIATETYKKPTPSQNRNGNISFVFSNRNRSVNRSFAHVTSPNSSLDQTIKSDDRGKTPSSVKSSTSSTSKSLKYLNDSPPNASNGTIAAFSIYPVFEPIPIPKPRKKTPPQKVQPSKKHHYNKVVVTKKQSHIKSQNDIQRRPKKEVVTPKPATPDCRPKRLGLIATILESLDERDLL